MSCLWGLVSVGERDQKLCASQAPLKTWLQQTQKSKCCLDWLFCVIVCIVQLEKVQELLIVHLLLCLHVSVRCVFIPLLSKCLNCMIQLFPLCSLLNKDHSRVENSWEQQLTYSPIYTRSILNDIVSFEVSVIWHLQGPNRPVFSWDVKHISSGLFRNHQIVVHDSTLKRLLSFSVFVDRGSAATCHQVI